MSFKTVGSLIGSSSRNPKTSTTMIALQVRQCARQVIERELFDFPEDLIKLIKVKSFKSGVLVVVTPGLVGAELQMRAERLRDAINTAFGRKIVKVLRIKAG